MIQEFINLPIINTIISIIFSGLIANYITVRGINKQLKKQCILEIKGSMIEVCHSIHDLYSRLNIYEDLFIFFENINKEKRENCCDAQYKFKLNLDKFGYFLNKKELNKLIEFEKQIRIFSRLNWKRTDFSNYNNEIAKEIGRIKEFLKYCKEIQKEIFYIEYND